VKNVGNQGKTGTFSFFRESPIGNPLLEVQVRRPDQSRGHRTVDSSIGRAVSYRKLATDDRCSPGQDPGMLALTGTPLTGPVDQVLVRVVVGDETAAEPA
jgi:hypothetical protein